MYPLCNYYTQELKIWQRNKPNKIVELADVGQIFGKAFTRAATLSNAQNGFQSAGIYPFNPTKFTDDVFVPSELTEREVPHEASQVENQAESSNDANLQNNSLRNVPNLFVNDQPGCSNWVDGDNSSLKGNLFKRTNG